MHGRFGQLAGALAAALISGLGFTACGGEDPARLATLAPPDVPLYAELVIRPDGEQEEAINSLAGRFGDVSDPGEELASAIDAEFADEGTDLTYADDVDPWLGEHGALFVRSFDTGPAGGGMPDFALMLETTDPDAARGFIDRLVEADPAPEQRRSYGGADYYALRGDGGGEAVGIVDDAFVLGTEMSFKVSVDAAQGQSLAESDDYSARVDALGDDLLATVSLDPSAVIDAAIASADIDPQDVRALEPLLGGPLSEPLAIGVSVTPESATADFAALVDDEREFATDTSLLEPLPAGSWLAVAMPDLGPTLGLALDTIANTGLPGSDSIVERVRDQTGIDLRANLTGWLGDAAAYVRGTAVPGLSAGLIAQTSDPQRPRPLLDLVQRLAERDTGLRSAGPPQGAEYGFSLGLPSLGGGVEAGIAGDQVVAVFGATLADALDPAQTLGSDERFRSAVEALGEEFPAALYVDVPSAVAALQATGQASELDDRSAQVLDALELVVGGSRLSDRVVVTRVTATLGEQGQ